MHPVTARLFPSPSGPRGTKRKLAASEPDYNAGGGSTTKTPRLREEGFDDTDDPPPHDRTAEYASTRDDAVVAAHAHWPADLARALPQVLPSQIPRSKLAGKEGGGGGRVGVVDAAAAKDEAGAVFEFAHGYYDARDRELGGLEWAEVEGELGEGGNAGEDGGESESESESEDDVEDAEVADAMTAAAAGRAVRKDGLAGFDADFVYGPDDVDDFGGPDALDINDAEAAAGATFRSDYERPRERYTTEESRRAREQDLQRRQDLEREHLRLDAEWRARILMRAEDERRGRLGDGGWRE
jgi:hypothetical protein